MTRTMLKNLETIEDKSFVLNYQSDCLLEGVEAKVYRPLMERETCGEYFIFINFYYYYQLFPCTYFYLYIH